MYASKQAALLTVTLNARVSSGTRGSDALNAISIYLGLPTTNRRTGGPVHQGSRMTFSVLRHLVRYFWLRSDDSLDEICNNLVARLLAGLIDLLQFCIGILVGVFFGLLVAAGLLDSGQNMSRDNELVRFTSDSNFLYSSSFFFRYSSISFWASALASFTLFVRSEGSAWSRHNRSLPHILWLWEVSRLPEDS
jgi:hypothetical protein